MPSPDGRADLRSDTVTTPTQEMRRGVVPGRMLATAMCTLSPDSLSGQSMSGVCWSNQATAALRVVWSLA